MINLGLKFEDRREEVLEVLNVDMPHDTGNGEKPGRAQTKSKTSALDTFGRGTVEADETYLGGKDKSGKRGSGGAGKTIVAAVIEREGDSVVQPVANIKGETLKGIVRNKVEPGWKVNNNELFSYRGLAQDFDHKVVDHSNGEYNKDGPSMNTAERFFALLKRGVHGTFHHVSPSKVDMYCNEFSFRFNRRQVSDSERFGRGFDAVDGRLDWYVGK